MLSPTRFAALQGLICDADPQGVAKSLLQSTNIRNVYPNFVLSRFYVRKLVLCIKKERINLDSFFPSTCFSLPLLREYDVRPYGRRVFPLLAQLILHELLAVALLNLCAPYFLNNLSFSRGHAQFHASQSIIHRGVCSASECARARSSSFPHNFTNGIRCTSAHFFTLCEDKAIQNTFYIFTIKYRFFMHFLVFVSSNVNYHLLY